MKSASHLHKRESPDGDFSEDLIFLESKDAASWLDHEIGRDVPREKPVNQPRRPRSIWPVRMLFVFLLLFFLLVAGMGTALYLGRHWLLAQAERKALEALAGRGVYLAYDSAHWEFPRGVVLSNVRIYEDPGHETLLLTASNLGWNQDLYALVRDRSMNAAHATVTFRDAIVTFYQRGEEVAALERLDAYVAATAREISIERFQAMFSGLFVDAAGTVMLGEVEAPAVAATDPAVAPRAADPPPALAERLDFGPLVELKRWLTVSSAEGAPPRLELAFHVPAGPDPAIDARGRLWGRSFHWREIPVDSLVGEFAYRAADRALELPQLSLVYRGAPIEGRDLKIRLPENRVEIGSLRSEADFADLVSRIDPERAEMFSSIEWIDAPEIELAGSVNLADFWNSDLAIDYLHRGGMKIDLQGRELPVRAAQGRFTVKDGTIATGNFEGAVLDGMVRGGFRVRPQADAFEYAADLKVADLPLQSLAGLAGTEKPMPGLLSGTFQGSGGADASRLEGAGEVHISGDDLLTIPVIGEIQELLGTVATVFGLPRQTAIDATYTVAGGQIQTEDLAVVGSGIRIDAAGTYRIPDRMVAARAKGFLDAVPGIPAEVIGKALEVSVEGPVDDLKTRIDNAPAAFSSDAAKAAFAAMETAAGAARTLAGGETDEPGDALPAAAAAAVSKFLNKAGNHLRKMGGGEETPPAPVIPDPAPDPMPDAPAVPVVGPPLPTPSPSSAPSPPQPSSAPAPAPPPGTGESAAAQKTPAPRPPAPKPEATPEETKIEAPEPVAREGMLRAVPLVPKPGASSPAFRD